MLDLLLTTHWGNVEKQQNGRAVAAVEKVLSRANVLEFLNLPTTHLPVLKADGTKMDLATQPGWKVIYFWSAACPCVTACEQYSFIPLASKYKGKVGFYGVVSGKYDLANGVPALQKAIDDRKLPYPIFLDNDHATALALHAQVTPQTFLLNPKNEIVFSGMPDDSRRYLGRTGKSGVTQTYLSEAIAQALAGKPIKRPRTENQGCIISW